MDAAATDVSSSTRLYDLFLLLAKLLDTAQQLSPGPERTTALRQIGRFQQRLALLVLSTGNRRLGFGAGFGGIHEG
jgi:hypothetical protein